MLMMADQKGKNIELWSIKDIIKNNEDGDFLAICESGKEYECKFVAKYRAMFFAIPDHENILGYVKIVNRL